MIYIHKQYLDANGTDVTTLPVSLQAKLTRFDATAANIEAAKNQEQKEKGEERLLLLSKELLDEIEEAEEPETVEEPKKEEKKKSGGSGLVWLAIGGIAAAFGVNWFMNNNGPKT